MEIFQIWIMAFFTLALFSFLYKDNPVYRLAEHIFAGLTAGYQVGLIWDTIVIQKLWDPMIYSGQWWLFLPGLLGFMMFARLFPKYSWLSRVSLAFVMGTTAGVFLFTQLHGLVLPQSQATMEPETAILAKVSDDYANNLAEFVIVDGTPDSTMAPDTVEVSAQVPTAVSEVDDGLRLEASGAGADRAFVSRHGTETVVLSAVFTDTTDLRFGDHYRATFKIRNPSGSETKLVVSRPHRYDGILIEDLGNGSYQAQYEYDPAGDQEVGAYDLSVEVTRNETRFPLTAVVIIGVLSTLIYFYFSKEHTGILGGTAKVGIWFIMISFGAHFGYTVMGRVSLLIGRVQFLIDDWIGSFSAIF